MSDPVPQRARLGEPGGVTVIAVNEQDDELVDTGRFSRLAEQVLHAQQVGGEVEMTLLFVAEPTMAELNQKFMGHDGPTDVLSFPIDDALVVDGRGAEPAGQGPGRLPPDEPDGPPLLLGDVVVCPSVARRNAPEHAGSYEDELALLVVHGVLHLLGLDHADDGERAAMQARERDALTRFWGPLAADPWGAT